MASAQAFSGLEPECSISWPILMDDGKNLFQGPLVKGQELWACSSMKRCAPIPW